MNFALSRSSQQPPSFGDRAQRAPSDVVKKAPYGRCATGPNRASFMIARTGFPVGDARSSCPPPPVSCSAAPAHPPRAGAAALPGPFSRFLWMDCPSTARSPAPSIRATDRWRRWGSWCFLRVHERVRPSSRPPSACRCSSARTTTGSTCCCGSVPPSAARRLLRPTPEPPARIGRMRRSCSSTRRRRRPRRATSRPASSSAGRASWW